MQILYGVRGERRIAEFELPWLNGYENSRPVRIGNAASKQFQLDVYGEDRRRDLSKRIAPGLKISEDRLAIADRAPEFLGNEMEGAGRRDLGSARPATSFHPFQSDGVAGLRSRACRWSKNAAYARMDISSAGNNSAIKFTAKFASAVTTRRKKRSPNFTVRTQWTPVCCLMPLIGFPAAEDERVRSTIAAVERELLEDGFVLRYRPQEEKVDGLPGREGVFLPCSFWLADPVCISIGEKKKRANCSSGSWRLRNDLGLLAEEYDPRAKRQLGNFPQAFSHVAIINTAYRLSKNPATS